MKKRVLALMLVLGMTFSLAACGSSNDKKSDDTKTETTDKDSKEKMTTVKWNYGSSGNVLVTIAEEEGYFKDEGIEIEPVGQLRIWMQWLFLQQARLMSYQMRVHLIRFSR